MFEEKFFTTVFTFYLKRKSMFDRESIVGRFLTINQILFLYENKSNV